MADLTKWNYQIPIPCIPPKPCSRHKPSQETGPPSTRLLTSKSRESPFRLPPLTRPTGTHHPLLPSCTTLCFTALPSVPLHGISCPISRPLLLLFFLPDCSSPYLQRSTSCSSNFNPNVINSARPSQKLPQFRSLSTYSYLLHRTCP